MKKIFYLFLFLPFVSFAQCSSWVGEPVTNSLELLDSASKIMNVKWEPGDTSREDAKIFTDENGFTFRINLKGSEVGSIYLNGTTESIDKFYTNYLLPKIKPCEKKSSPTWIFWNDLKLVHVANGKKRGVSMSYIEIERT